MSYICRHKLRSNRWIEWNWLGNYFNICAWSLRAEIQIVVGAVTDSVLTNIWANNAIEDNATPAFFSCHRVPQTMRPFVFAQGRQSRRIARQRVCGRVQCCFIYATCHSAALFALLLFNNFFNTFLPSPDEFQRSYRRSKSGGGEQHGIVLSVCICVKNGNPFLETFCRF